MVDCKISPAAVRLYARSVEIEIEVEEAISFCDHLTTEELLAWSDRLLRGDLNVEA
jgi:capsule polysaccharide export protein KpsC/LpsZ